eukprot:scaffold23100_cov39-Attheya_sp.AAC.2
MLETPWSRIFPPILDWRRAGVKDTIIRYEDGALQYISYGGSRYHSRRPYNGRRIEFCSLLAEASEREIGATCDLFLRSAGSS